MFSVCQHLRGNDEWHEPWEHYADCADTCTYSQVLKLIHSGFSWIQTHDVCFGYGPCAPSPPKSAIFKV